MCASGRETLCLHNQGNIGAKIDGAFAEYVVVPARNLVRIPEGVVLREAGVIADAVATPTTLRVSERASSLGSGWRLSALVGASACICSRWQRHSALL